MSSGKRKFFIIVGLLFVAGVAIAGVLYVTFPRADDDLRRHGTQLSQVAVCRRRAR